MRGNAYEAEVHRHLRISKALALGVKAIALAEDKTDTEVMRDAIALYISYLDNDFSHQVMRCHEYGDEFDQLDVEANQYIARRQRQRQESARRLKSR